MSRLFRARIAILIAVSTAVAGPLLAQPASPGPTVKPPTQIVSISPISLVFGAIGVEYEVRTGPSASFGASGTYFRLSDIRYVSGEVKYRYYPQEHALEGFGVGLTGGVTQIAVVDGSTNDAGSAISLGFALDYQWLLGPKKHFAVTLGTGARRLFPIGAKVDGANFTLPTFRISVGRAF